MKPSTVIAISLGALAIGALAVLAFRTDPVPVDLAEVQRGPMQVTVDVEGETRIAELYEVAAPIRGNARRAPVRVGDPVIAGETVVAILDPAASDPLDARSRVQAEAATREAEAGLHMAQSTLRQAEEELQLAISEHNRTRELVDRGVASLTRLESAEQTLAARQAARRAAESNLERAQSALDRARAALIDATADTTGAETCCMSLTAPVDGQVLDIDTISARPVAAGTRLLTIGQPQDLEIVADVLSTDAVRLKVGDRAEVLRWGGDKTLEATISRIEPSAYTKVSALGIEEQRVDVVFDLVTPAEDRQTLGHGFSVYLRVVEWEGRDILQVPLSALFRRGSDWAVFVAVNDAASLRMIETGKMNPDRAQVLSGLEAGDTVILHPNDSIRDGVSITPRQAE
ncbi:Macrolide export protein MacA [Roseovarius sp. THAF9]|uniref:efflux RND transporter periplasmic adaptor subunit n=1 Tax=Roseovarius sp. THAF9 TaxID=2587847 RepID=UPI0012AAB3A9|nr:HlyD family efflux transporter periplasmic adaptor subunit [Roseovarius sp. THAF9]QFT92374.1 Macrolide export protein MacA [Roseovarius sp. THAF9]